jgi:hypothetical protein
MNSDTRSVAALIRDEIKKQFPDTSLRVLDRAWGIPEGTVGRISNTHMTSSGAMGVRLLPTILEHLPNLKPYLTDANPSGGVRKTVSLTPEGEHAFRLLFEKEVETSKSSPKKTTKASSSSKKTTKASSKKTTKASPKTTKASPKTTKTSKSTPKKTEIVIVERNMSVDIIARLVHVSKNPKTVDQWIELASHIEDAGHKVSALLRAIQNQVD